MIRTNFTLTKNVPLTHNVHELSYHCRDITNEVPLPGQYIMFQLAPGLNRAYSLSDYHAASSIFTLIIKRIPEGKGSPIICDAKVGTIFSGMIPLGHFTLRNTRNKKCFIGTGTGFAPLYFQIKSTLESYP